MQAYQSNGARVPPNNILTTAQNGAAIFTNSIYISSITASTIDVITLNASTINTSTLNASTLNASTLNANTINVSTLNASTISSTTVIHRLTVKAGTNDTASGASPPGYMSEFIRLASSGTFTTDYQVAGNGVDFGGTNFTWQDARYVYNNGIAPGEFQVWSIATSSIATSAIAPNIGGY
jgi:hypothetical protein